jgi:hypothetical protein
MNAQEQPQLEPYSVSTSQCDVAIDNDFLKHMVDVLPEHLGMYPNPQDVVTSPQAKIVSTLVVAWNEDHEAKRDQVTMLMGIRCLRILGNAKHS